MKNFLLKRTRGRRKIRRVLFNVPGSDTRKLEKAKTLDIDSVVLDFEDGVAFNEKQRARELIPKYLSDINMFGRSERCVRINSIGSGFEREDINCLLPVFSNIEAIVLPKVDEPSQVRELDDQLTQGGDKEKRIKILASIESGKALINLRSICQSSTRLDALIFASEDYSAEVGITRTKEGTELLYPRSKVATYASAYGYDGIDMVCIHYNDKQQLEMECKQGYHLGFTGKQAIHPSQLEVIYTSFKPPKEDIEQAQKIIESFQANQDKGIGAYSIDGKMIDLPMLKWAFRILDKANISIEKKE